jgi:DNA-binding HxlR family transcriptional regulator
MSQGLDGEAFKKGSPARCLLARIADKWAVLILSTLLQRPTHFLELHRDIGGVSRKVLTDEVRKLERDGLVQRRADRDSSGVQYSLTALGKSLCTPINQLRRWAEKHAVQVERAQMKFDEAGEKRRTVDGPSRG